MGTSENPLEDHRFKETCEQITQWLKQYGYFIESQPAGKFAWALSAKDELDFSVNIAQHRGNLAFISVGARLLLDELHVKRLQEMGEDERAKAVADIGLCLLGMGMSFAVGPPPVSWLGMSTRVFREGLVGKDLVAAIELTRRGFQAVVWMMAKILGELPPPHPESEETIH